MKKNFYQQSGIRQFEWLTKPQEGQIKIAAGENLRQLVVIEEGLTAQCEYWLDKAGSSLELLIIFIGSNDKTISVKAQIRHLARQTRSRIAFKAILFDNSKADFQGNIFVDENGHEADTYLKSEAVMMSEQAVCRTIPSLEIIANDVKAGHAATSGALDEDSLFYLESRGFDEESARKLLLEAFLAEAAQFFSDFSENEQSMIAENLIKLLK